MGPKTNKRVGITYKKKVMNSVIAYKQSSLREGLAELLAPEIINLDAFKSFIAKSAMSFRSTFGYDKECHDKTHDRYERDGHDKGHERSTGC